MPKKAPYFPLYTSDFMQGTLLFDAQETGAYILLLCYQWDNGFIPSDEKSLKKIAKISQKKLEKVLKKFTLTSDSFYKNDRVEMERSKFIEKSEKARQSINSRWAKTEQENDTNVLRTNYERNTETILPIQTNPNYTNTNVLVKEEEGVNTPTPIAKEKKTELDFSFLDIEQNKPFKEVFREWWVYRVKEKKKPFKTQTTLQKAFDYMVELSGGNVDAAKKIVNQAIANTWQGLQPLKNDNNNSGNSRKNEPSFPSDPDQRPKVFRY